MIELIWIGFIALFLGLLFLDLSVLHREAAELSVRQALFWTAVWIGVAFSYAFVIYGLYEYRWYGFVPAGEASNGSGRRRAVRHRLPARVVAVGRQHLRHGADLRVPEDPAALPVPSAVLGHRRRDRAARHDDHGRHGAAAAFRLDVLRVRRDAAGVGAPDAARRRGSTRLRREPAGAAGAALRARDRGARPRAFLRAPLGQHSTRHRSSWRWSWWN